ncbi:stage III sporulation protein SpoIIIAB [Fictibacillus sp. Mic-4]|uniref:stage III sporulation protein SpoIIIAB n=1 Tax=Fictibacillus sp. Mic-4 TaxID=3132826 RepID=UPI003CFB524D
MNWLGAICILAASTWMGFELAKKVTDRTKQLRNFKVALQSLEAEIMYGLIPLDEAFLHLSEQLHGPTSDFFRMVSEKLTAKSTTVQQAWDEAINENRHQLALKNNELEILRQFGATLGRHDRQNQQKQIKLALTHLERELSEAKDAQVKYEKMFKSLGFLTGLLLIILLI